MQGCTGQVVPGLMDLPSSGETSKHGLRVQCRFYVLLTVREGFLEEVSFQLGS